jgi:MFS superfamily sulfate permease-like transporter
MSAAASAINIQTGVFTPVSSFVVVSFVVSLLLVGLVIILSLLLTCLTRLMRLESLVRQIGKSAARNAQGD